MRTTAIAATSQNGLTLTCNTETKVTQHNQVAFNCMAVIARRTGGETKSYEYSTKPLGTIGRWSTTYSTYRPWTGPGENKPESKPDDFNIKMLVKPIP